MFCNVTVTRIFRLIVLQRATESRKFLIVILGLEQSILFQRGSKCLEITLMTEQGK